MMIEEIQAKQAQVDFEFNEITAQRDKLLQSAELLNVELIKKQGVYAYLQERIDALLKDQGEDNVQQTQ